VPARAQDDAASQSNDTGGRIAFRFERHPSLRLGDIARVDAMAKVQLDWRTFAVDPSAPTFDLHRARIGLSGNVLKLVEYQLEREIGDDTDPWRDAFVNVNAARALEIRAGRFKMPFSLDQLTGAMDLDFAYRSLAASSLAPGRDVGATVHGRFAGRVVHYEAGWFRRGGENVRASERRDPQSGGTFAARVSAALWDRKGTSPALHGLTIGGGLTDGRLPDGLNSIAGRDVADAGFFRKVYVSGRRRRVGADVEWRTGPASVRGEVMRVLDDRHGQGTDDNDLPPARAAGSYVSATWLVTGEKKKDDLRPRRPLFQGGAGAIEVAARLERLAFGSDGEGAPAADPRASQLAAQSDRAVTLGVNWYLNRFVRLQADVIREHRLDGGAVPAGATDAWTRIVRLQFGL
jgi:phosphate-selective porin OprO/OprP